MRVRPLLGLFGRGEDISLLDLGLDLLGEGCDLFLDGGHDVVGLLHRNELEQFLNHGFANGRWQLLLEVFLGSFNGCLELGVEL